MEGIAGRTLITVTNQDDQVVSSLHCAPGDPVAVEHCEYCEHCEHCEQMTGGGQDETPQEVPATPGQRVHLLQLSYHTNSYKLIQRYDTKWGCPLTHLYKGCIHSLELTLYGKHRSVTQSGSGRAVWSFAVTHSNIVT